MNALPSYLRRVFGVVVFLAVGILAPALESPSPRNAVWAQEENPPAETESNPPAESSADLPHTKFLLDYVIVLALIAVALYAVCRSSRRV